MLSKFRQNTAGQIFIMICPRCSRSDDAKISERYSPIVHCLYKIMASPEIQDHATFFILCLTIICHIFSAFYVIVRDYERMEEITSIHFIELLLNLIMLYLIVCGIKLKSHWLTLNDTEKKHCVAFYADLVSYLFISFTIFSVVTTMSRFKSDEENHWFKIGLKEVCQLTILVAYFLALFTPSRLNGKQNSVLFFVSRNTDINLNMTHRAYHYLATSLSLGVLVNCTNSVSFAICSIRFFVSLFLACFIHDYDDRKRTLSFYVTTILYFLAILSLRIDYYTMDEELATAS
jgi:hypothetical protein